MPESTELKPELDDLRQRSQSANYEQMDGLLSEARALLKKAFQTELEEDARQLFREIRERAEKSASQEASSASADEVVTELLKRIQKEETRSGTGIMDDIQLAINGLGEILKQTPPQNKAVRQEAFSVLEKIALKGPIMRKKVEDMLKSDEIQQTEDIIDLLQRLGRSQSSPRDVHEPSTESSKHTPSSSSAGRSSSEVDDKLANARRKFYAGEYYDAIDLLSEVLRVDPKNAEALQRLAQAEDNIKRGVVPDTRIPFEACSAYGKAQSLERAQKYEEAKDFFNIALQEARKGGPELANWPPAIEALLRIEQEIIAQQTRDEADILMRQDKWREAIERYEIVLKLSPGDSKAQNNIELLRKVLDQFERARIQLTSMTGSMGEMAEMIIDLRGNMQKLRPQMGESKLLASIDSEINARARSLKTRMFDRANNLLTQVSLTPAISERKRMLTEATKLLDQSVLIASDDEAFELASTAALDLQKVNEAEKGLVEARRYINSNTEQESRMAKDKLRELREYNQDPVFRQLVAVLLRQYLDHAEDSMREKQFPLAAQWVSAAKEEPFKVLGRSDEIYRLEQEIEVARRQPLVLRVLYVGGISIKL